MNLHSLFLASTDAISVSERERGREREEREREGEREERERERELSKGVLYTVNGYLAAVILISYDVCYKLGSRCNNPGDERALNGGM